MSNLTVFQFETQEVRFVGTADDPWWVAADVCSILDISKPENVYSRLDDDEKDTRIVGTLGGSQKMVCINESGLYSLVLKSRKPQAKRFKKWVTSEVLPTIRKNGSYAVAHNQDVASPDLIQEAIAAVFAPTNLDKNLVAGVIANAIARQYPQLTSAMEEAKKHLSTPVEETLLTATELTVLYAEKTGENLSAIAMNKLLENAGLQQKNPDGKNPRWLPVGQGNEFGQLVLDTAKGRDKTIQTLKWYPSVLEVLCNA